MISGVLQILSFNIPNTKDFFQLVYGLSSVIWRVETLFNVLNIKDKALKTLQFFLLLAGVEDAKVLCEVLFLHSASQCKLWLGKP